MLKTLLAAAALVALAAPAFADAQWFIVRGPDHHCRVVAQRPVEKEVTVVNPNGAVYQTETEATNAMRTVTVCH
ncbi:MAG TPA: hypothetical protein VMB84_00130 [Stellaceae bacterium]|nr:hypothetical protein [Stellaceae bacterium]